MRYKLMEEFLRDYIEMIAEARDQDINSEQLKNAVGKNITTKTFVNLQKIYGKSIKERSEII